MAVFQFNLFCSKIPDDILQSVFERFEIENADHRALRSQEWKQEWEHTESNVIVAGQAGN